MKKKEEIAYFIKENFPEDLCYNWVYLKPFLRKRSEKYWIFIAKFSGKNHKNFSENIKVTISFFYGLAKHFNAPIRHFTEPFLNYQGEERNIAWSLAHVGIYILDGYTHCAGRNIRKIMFIPKDRPDLYEFIITQLPCTFCEWTK